MDRLGEWTKPLKEHKTIHFILELHLFFMRINRGISASYDRLIVSFEPEASKTETSEKQNADQKTNEVPDWDWQHFPKPLPGSGTITCITTCWMAYALVRTLFQVPLYKVVSLVSKPYLNMPGNCVLLGRLLAHPKMDDTFIMGLCLFHLVWRTLQRFARRYFKLTMLYFMFFSERDLERFHRLLEQDDSKRAPEYSWPRDLAEWNLVWPLEAEFQLNGAHLAGRHRDDRPRRRFSSDQDSKLVSRMRTVPNRQPAAIGRVEQLLRFSMCYQVHYGNQLYFRLRPNRTRQARQMLIDQAATSFAIATIIFALLFVFYSVYLFLMNMSDWRYVSVYPGCTERLDRLYSQGKLSSYSISLGRHRLVALLVDVVENAFVWIDCALSIVFVPTFAYLLNYDLLLYWHSLNAKLERALERTRARDLLQLELYQNWSGFASGTLDEGNDLVSLVEFQQQTGPMLMARLQQRARIQQQRSRRPRASLGAGPPLWSPALSESPIVRLDRELELEIHELQFEIFDFFHEVHRVDLLVSDILTMSMVIWLVSCSVVGHNFLIDSDSPVPMVIVITVLVGFLVILSATYVLLELRRRCLRSYMTLCSLMAHDRSRRKRRFTRMMDFFTRLNGTTYTLAQNYPYEPTTFITILGWSASCFILALTLFGHREPQSVAGRARALGPSATPSSSPSVYERVPHWFGL